jgi:hypothetical protein
MNLYQPTITGSLSVSGSVNISGSITIAGGGTISGTASIATTALTASSADNLLVRNTLTAQTLVVQTITSSVDFVTGSTRFGSIAANTHQFTGSMSVSGSGTFAGSLILNSADNRINSGNELRFYRADNAIYTRIYDAGSLAANGFTLDNMNAEGFHFKNNGTTIMRMNSSGNVGIGTNAPNSILEISSATPIIRIQASDSGTFHGIEFRQAGGFDAFIKQLPVTGEFKISSGRSVGWGGFTTFYTDTVERMRIASSGQVVAPFGYQSFKGSISLTASQTATIYTMPQASAADGVYYVYCRLNGGAAIYMASAIVTALAANSELFISNTRTGANVGLSVSGRDIRITNGGFGTFTWQWSILFQPVD